MKQQLYNQLKSGDNLAITHVRAALLPSVKNRFRLANLPEWTAEEFVHDAILKAIQKANDGSYVFDGKTHPVTYIMGIVKMDMLTAIKKQRKERIDYDCEITSCKHYYHETTDLLSGEQMLSIVLRDVPSHISELLYLRYGLGYRDKEIVEDGLTHFQNYGSVRVSCDRYKKRLCKYNDFVHKFLH